MRNWCCFCFDVNDDGYEEVEEGKPSGLGIGEMRGSDLANEGGGGAVPVPEGFPVNDDVEGEEEEEGGDEEVELELRLAPRGRLRIFRGLGSHLIPGFGCGLARGESSNGAPGDDSDPESHHKRVKFYSGSYDFNYFSAMPSNAGNCPSSSSGRDFVPSRRQPPNEKIPQNFLWDNISDDKASSSCDERDNRGEGGNLKDEDFVVWMDLSDDLLHMVFSFLDHINLCRAAMVCTQWRAASAHEDFWRCLNFENRPISLERFERMCVRYPNATEVNVYSTPAVQFLAMIAISSLRLLEVLTLGRGLLADPFFHALTDCTSLRILIINDATLGNGIHEISINHYRLRDLQITKCRVMRVSVSCPLLETLSLKRSNMTQAVLNCPLLHLLDIGSCHKLSDAAIRSTATSCPQLESLDMSNCSRVSNETLREISLTCPNLHILNASYCPNISLESVRLPLLTVLKLHSCEGITLASMTAISYSSMLEVLELDDCSLLTSVSLVLPRLQNIRLVHCRKFLELNLRSTMLSSITVSNCPALHRISISSNSLQKLALQKQENLTTLALQCPNLLELDVTDCESLTNSICEVLNDGGGCPVLRSLVLDNCESLTSVRFCCTSLVSLSLIGCRTVTSLDLTCPRLEQVFLDGCDHLERASFCPVALSSLNLGICPKLHQLHIEAPYLLLLELKGCGVLSDASINCPLLSSLNLGMCPKLHQLDIEAPYLLLLELKGCGVLSDASINCPLLTSLDTSFCSQLKDDCLSATTASCMLIESLILMSCPLVGDDGLYSLHSLPNLTVLDLSYTFLMTLRPVFKFCLKLKVLKLQACKYLTDKALEPLYKEGALPMLQELDLSYGTLSQSAIEELFACCTHLTHLSLNGYVNLHDLNWGCNGVQIDESPSFLSLSPAFPWENTYDPNKQPNRLLQNLNCVGCLNIRKVLIPSSARCLHLSSLNLSLSANLKEVDISCYNLCFLNLSNCYSLESLKLECPRLTSLFLQSCNIDEKTVQAAISECGMLKTLNVCFCPKICSISMGQLRAACPSLKHIFSSLST